MTNLDLNAAYVQKRLTFRRIYRVAFGTLLGLLLVSFFLSGSFRDLVAFAMFAALLVCIGSDFYLWFTRCPGCGHRLKRGSLRNMDQAQAQDPYIFCPRCTSASSDAAAESETSRVS